MMRKVWSDKLSKTGKLIVHSKKYKWIRVQEYWGKWRVETCWSEDWVFSSSEEALQKIQELIK